DCTPTARSAARQRFCSCPAKPAMIEMTAFRRMLHEFAYFADRQRAGECTTAGARLKQTGVCGRPRRQVVVCAFVSHLETGALGDGAMCASPKRTSLSSS